MLRTVVIMFLWSVLVTFIVTSVHPRKKDPPSVVPPEVSYFPCLGFFKLRLRFVGLRAEDVTTVQSVTAQ